MSIELIKDVNKLCFVFISKEKKSKSHVNIIKNKEFVEFVRLKMKQKIHTQYIIIEWTIAVLANDGRTVPWERKISKSISKNILWVNYEELCECRWHSSLSFHFTYPISQHHFVVIRYKIVVLLDVMSTLLWLFESDVDYDMVLVFGHLNSHREKYLN